MPAKCPLTNIPRGVMRPLIYSFQLTERSHVTNHVTFKPDLKNVKNQSNPATITNLIPFEGRGTIEAVKYRKDLCLNFSNTRDYLVENTYAF